MAWITVSNNDPCFNELGNQQGQQDFLDEELRNDNYEVEQSKIVKGNYYALVKDMRAMNHHKLIMVGLIEHDKRTKDFNYKLIAETCGPVCYDCPARMIQQADTPVNDTAEQWRQRCAGRCSQQKLLKQAREQRKAILVHWFDGDYRCEYYAGNRAWLHARNDGYYDQFKVKDILDAGFDVV